jgi:hypothetical protein
MGQCEIGFLLLEDRGATRSQHDVVVARPIHSKVSLSTSAFRLPTPTPTPTPNRQVTTKLQPHLLDPPKLSARS